MIALLGWLGSALVVVSLIQRDMHRLRQVNLAAAGALGVFNLALGIPSMIVLNGVLAAVNGYHLCRGRAARRRMTATPVDPAASTVLASSGGDRPVDSRILIEQHWAAAGGRPSVLVLH